jgi:hypothetical protein
MDEALGRNCGASLAFVAHQALIPQKTAPLLFMASRREPDDDDDVVFSSIEKIGNTLSRPTPGLPSLPIAYPLALASSFLLIPLPTALLLTAFFVGYSFLAQQVLDKGENNKMDFAVLLAAIASAGLVSPSGFANANGQGLAQVVAVVGLGLIVATVTEALPSDDERSLDEWDDRFDNENK